jgi:putative redox protein
MTLIETETAKPGEYPQIVRVRSHTLAADVGPESGSTDSAPGAHDYFDAALAACKALTATWYARRQSIPLERVETRIESDATQERAGVYKLTVRVTLHGPMTDEQRASIHRAIEKCPIHKLMTTADIQIETIPEAS